MGVKRTRQINLMLWVASLMGCIKKPRCKQRGRLNTLSFLIYSLLETLHVHGIHSFSAFYNLVGNTIFFGNRLSKS